MPYPNEHSARLKEPGQFNPKSFRRTKDGTIYGKIKVPQTVSTIWGKLKGKDKPADQPVPQALRFPTSSWTAEKAKKWLKDNNVKYIKFEAASGKEKSSIEKVQEKYNCECIDCGYTLQSEKHCSELKCPKCGGQMRRKERPGPGKDKKTQSNIFSTIAQMETQIWIMEAHALKGLFETITKQETFLPNDIEIVKAEPELNIRNKTAIIPIKGVLMREIPSAFAFWGIEGTSYTSIQKRIEMAANNEEIENIILDVDSPGGTVTGVMETADAIYNAGKIKNVTAIVDDLGASGAYWLISQANNIEIVPNGMIGSIGVFSVYADSSKRAEDMGYKIHIVRSGEHKGMGVPGAEITVEQLNAIQEMIDGIAGNFIEAVARGRQKEKAVVTEWATGRLWLADVAKKMGIADKLIKPKTNNFQLKGKKMSEIEQNSSISTTNIDNIVDQNEIEEKARSSERAVLKDFKDAFPDDLEFAVDAFSKGLTVEQAKAEYCDVLKERLQNQSQQAEGAEAVATGGHDEDENKGDFLEEAREMAKEKGISVTKAMRHLARKDPDFHKAFKEKCMTEGKQMYQRV